MPHRTQPEPVNPDEADAFEDELETGRLREFVKFPAGAAIALLEASAAEYATYLAILDHRNDGSGQAWPSAAALASKTGRNVGTVRNALKRLEERGLIESLGRIKRPDGLGPHRWQIPDEHSERLQVRRPHPSGGNRWHVPTASEIAAQDRVDPRATPVENPHEDRVDPRAGARESTRRTASIHAEGTREKNQIEELENDRSTSKIESSTASNTGSTSLSLNEETMQRERQSERARDEILDSVRHTYKTANGITTHVEQGEQIPGLDAAILTAFDDGIRTDSHLTAALRRSQWEIHPAITEWHFRRLYSLGLVRWEGSGDESRIVLTAEGCSALEEMGRKPMVNA